jgi:TonB family protein
MTKEVRPVYPNIAILAGVEGVVRVEARIGPDGRVTDARVIRSIPVLDNAALDAVRQWEFVPPAGDATFVATVTFVLSRTPVSSDAQPAGVVGWPPSDFGLYYRFKCRDGVRQIASGEFIGSWSPVSRTLSAEASNRLSLLLIQEGFFSIPDAVTERSVRPAFRVLESGIEVTVADRQVDRTFDAEASGTATGSSPFHHELMVRTFGVWRIVKWNEPIAADDERGAEASRVGAAVRRFFRSLEEKGAANTAECR